MDVPTNVGGVEVSRIDDVSIKNRSFLKSSSRKPVRTPSLMYALKILMEVWIVTKFGFDDSAVSIIQSWGWNTILKDSIFNRNARETGEPSVLPPSIVSEETVISNLQSVPLVKHNFLDQNNNKI
ncbi:hypothetical protein AVEN_5362-1 [Araneus ventricosus]|uniref:Uncharacterized protein n=1 Tax=Araneus ventricosus TaxID=182803 RepID=A0A4Y2T238_ARAVE|nr:hypothetical protein AVEN_5362-1 [Araneus ventricosus]